MKNKISLIKFASLMFALPLLLATTANAQYLVSTKAGFVNRTEGKVYILRSDSQDGDKGRASLGTQMRTGDQLSTEAASYAELLLNPNSYLRLSENTEVRAVDTSLSSVRFEVIKGAAIVEVGEVDKKTPIEILTPKGTLTFAKDTLVRIEVNGPTTAVAVRQGEVELGTSEQFMAKQTAKIGRGKVAYLNGSSNPETAKLNKDLSDNFDAWSFNRAQTLTAANSTSLRRSGVLSAFSTGWYYDPLYNCYTFIPSGRRFFSPYGFGFFNNWGDGYYYQPYGYGYGYGYGGYGYSGGGYNGSGGGSGVPSRVVTGVDRAPIRREAQGRGIDTGSGAFDSGRSAGGNSGSGRSISAPSSVSSPAVFSSPAPSRGDSGGGSGGGRPSGPTRQ